MSQLTIILWLLNIVIDTAGQLAFKAAALGSVKHQGTAYWKHLFTQPWIWVGFTCYIIEFVLWLAFLTLIPLSVGVMLGSINTVAIMIAGRMWFKERLTPLRLLGVTLITVGVAVVGIN